MSQQLPEWARRDAPSGPSGVTQRIRGGSFVSTAAKVTGWSLVGLGVLGMLGAAVVYIFSVTASESDFGALAGASFAISTGIGGLVVFAFGLALLMQALRFEDEVVYR